MNTQSKNHSLIWGGLLILFGVVGLAETFIDLSAWAWVVILAAAGFGVFGVYQTERSEWGLFILAYVFWAIAGLVALIELNILRDEGIATFVLAAIALPFLVAFLRDREKWGLLIPAYVLLAVGVMVGLIGLGILNDLLIPSYVMFAIAIPFFVVYWNDRQQWWPLIPSGILAVIGLAFLIAEAAVEYVVPVALILIGGWLLMRQFVKKEPDALDVSAKIDQDAGKPPTE